MAIEYSSILPSPLAAPTMSVSPEQIPRIDLVLHIIQAAIVAIRNDSLTLFLELFKIIYNHAAKEGAAIFQSRLVDDHRSTLCLNALHDTLDAALAEIIGIGLHGQAIDT